MYAHMSRCTVTCHDARSHVTMHGHMNINSTFDVQYSFSVLDQAHYVDILRWRYSSIYS
jgi:hypothetical protein